MEKNWNDKAEMLSKVGVDVSVFDMGQLNPSEQDRQAGLDIADFILRAKPSDKESMYREFEEIKRHWRKNNPELYNNIMKLFNDFDFELISIEPMTEEELAKYGKSQTSTATNPLIKRQGKDFLE